MFVSFNNYDLDTVKVLNWIAQKIYCVINVERVDPHYFNRYGDDNQLHYIFGMFNNTEILKEM